MLMATQESKYSMSGVPIPPLAAVAANRNLKKKLIIDRS